MDRASEILEEARARALKRHKSEDKQTDTMATGVEAWCMGVSRDCVEEAEEMSECEYDGETKKKGRAETHLEDLLGESSPPSNLLSSIVPGGCINSKTHMAEEEGSRPEDESPKEVEVDCRVAAGAGCCVRGTSKESVTKLWCKESRQARAHRAAAAA